MLCRFNYAQVYRRLVSVHIIPFRKDGNRYALHILNNKREIHDQDYFTEAERFLYNDGNVKSPQNFDPPKIRVDYLVRDIRNPAYVTYSRKGSISAWNEEFQILTYFTAREIDTNRCHLLFKGENKEHCCSPECKFKGGMSEAELHFLENYSIISKDKEGNDTKKLVDVYIIPLQEGCNKYALHILREKRLEPDSSL